MKTYTPTPSYDNYLEHHGVLGMHWGVQNGPPYPLGSDVSTGKRLKNPMGADKNDNISPSTEKPRNKVEKDVKGLNKSGDDNNNCAYCSLAYEMRRRNLKVSVTKPQPDATSTPEIWEMYGLKFEKGSNNSVYKDGSFPGDSIFSKNKKPKIVNYPNLLKGYIQQCRVYTHKELEGYMKKKYPEGSRGIFLMPWARSRYMYGIECGHCVSWELDKGKLKIIDPQNNAVIKNADKVLERVDCFDLIELRTDNKTLNSKYIEKGGIK